MPRQDRPLAVVAAVVVDHGRVLACRRAPGRPAAGRWEFPGGKIEPHETAEQALRREVREELGIELVDARPFTCDDTPVDGRIIRLVCFHARLAAAPPTVSTDHDALAWLGPDDLDSVDWATPDLPAVAKLRETIW